MADMQVSLNNAHPNRRLGIGCVPWVGGVRAFRDLNGVEAGLISGVLPILPMSLD